MLKLATCTFDHDHLEYNHNYIQWLFPIREQGLNMYADMLQLHEAEVSRIIIIHDDDFPN